MTSVQRYSILIWVILILLLLNYRGAFQIDLGDGFDRWTTSNTLTEFDSLWWSGLESVSGQLRVSPYAIAPRFLELLEDTKYSILGAWYVISRDEAKEVMRKKAREGVDIRIMLESKLFGDDPAKSFNAFKSSIQGTRIQLQDDSKIGTNYHHIKTMVLDDTTAYLASSNVTYSAMFNNREHHVVVTKPEIVKSISYVLEQDRNHKPLDHTQIHPNIIVCPLHCRAKIESLIDMATGSLWMQTQYIQDTRIIEKLIDAQNRGVVLRIIVSDNQEPWRLEPLWKSVRIQQDPYVHSKSMLIDDQWLMIGSANFSTNALDNNREMNIVINNQKSLDLRKEHFLEDWNVISE